MINDAGNIVNAGGNDALDFQDRPTIVLDSVAVGRGLIRSFIQDLQRFFERGKRIAIQEYGIANPELVKALEQRGALVTSIPIYRWALPEDLASLRGAIEKIIGGGADVALFTNGAQVDHLLQVAGLDNRADALRQGFKKIVIGSVGPVCTEVLRQFGIEPDIEPVHPKMGALIAEVAARAPELLAIKRRG